jgi:hypothetical protein
MIKQVENLTGLKQAILLNDTELPEAFDKIVNCMISDGKIQRILWKEAFHKLLHHYTLLMTKHVRTRVLCLSENDALRLCKNEIMKGSKDFFRKKKSDILQLYRKKSLPAAFYNHIIEYSFPEFRIDKKLIAAEIENTLKDRKNISNLQEMFNKLLFKIIFFNMSAAPHSKEKQINEIWELIYDKISASFISEYLSKMPEGYEITVEEILADPSNDDFTNKFCDALSKRFINFITDSFFTNFAINDSIQNIRRENREVFNKIIELLYNDVEEQIQKLEPEKNIEELLGLIFEEAFQDVTLLRNKESKHSENFLNKFYEAFKIKPYIYETSTYRGYDLKQANTSYLSYILEIYFKKLLEGTRYEFHIIDPVSKETEKFIKTLIEEITVQTENRLADIKRSLYEQLLMYIQISFSTGEKHAKDIAEKVWGQLVEDINLSPERGGYNTFQFKKSFFNYITSTYIPDYKSNSKEVSLDEINFVEENLESLGNDLGYEKIEEVYDLLKLKFNSLKELFKLVFLCGGYPHEQLAFGFSQLVYGKLTATRNKNALPKKPLTSNSDSFKRQRGIEGKPAEVAKNHANTSLDKLKSDFWEAFVSTSYPDEQADFYKNELEILKGYLSPLEKRLNLTVDKLNDIVIIGSSEISAKNRKISSTCLTDYKKADRNLVSKISDWCIYVKETVYNIIYYKIDNTSGEKPSASIETLEKISKHTQNKYKIRPGDCQCKLKNLPPCYRGASAEFVCERKIWRKSKTK